MRLSMLYAPLYPYTQVVGSNIDRWISRVLGVYSPVATCLLLLNFPFQICSCFNSTPFQFHACPMPALISGLNSTLFRPTKQLNPSSLTHCLALYAGSQKKRKWAWVQAYSLPSIPLYSPPTAIFLCWWLRLGSTGTQKTTNRLKRSSERVWSSAVNMTHGNWMLPMCSSCR